MGLVKEQWESPFAPGSVKGDCFIVLARVHPDGLSAEDLVHRTTEMGHDWSHAKTPANSIAASLGQDSNHFVRVGPSIFAVRKQRSVGPRTPPAAPPPSQADLHALEAAPLDAVRQAFLLAFGALPQRLAAPAGALGPGAAIASRAWLLAQLRARAAQQRPPPPPQPAPAPAPAPEAAEEASAPRKRRLPGWMALDEAEPAKPAHGAPAAKPRRPPAPCSRLSRLPDHPVRRGAPAPAPAPRQRECAEPPPLPLAPLACMRLACGTLVRPGDDVFVLTPAGVRELHLCAVCRGPERQQQPLLECERCLRGFHPACCGLSCLPGEEARWDCRECLATAGGRPSVCDVRRLDDGLLFLARVEALWYDPGQSGCFFRARWYAPPCKQGRLATNWWLPAQPGASQRQPLREVALGPPGDADVASLSCVLRAATVVRPEQAAEAAAAAEREGRPPPLVCHHSLEPGEHRARLALAGTGAKRRLGRG